MSEHVVITGIGSICGFGVGPDALWNGLESGESAIGPIERFDASAFTSRLAGELAEFSAKGFVPKSYRKAVKIMARDIELAVAAAGSAVDHAGLITLASEGDQESTYTPDRMGCQIGAGLIMADTDELSLALQASRNAEGTFDMGEWGDGGMNNLTPLWMLKYLPNMLACHVTILHGTKGPSNTITCCEASGLLCIGESVRVIRRGAADLCFSGGAESKVSLMSMMRMEIAGRLAPTGDATSGADVVKPFDPESGGTLVGEGGGILILERPETAEARGATPLASIIGIGSAQSEPDYADGHDDEGLRFAIENALDDAGISADEIDAVVPLASGIPALDRAEAGALRHLLASRSKEVPIITLTPAVGNCMAGAGGLQAVVGVLALQHQRLPARLNAGTPDPELDAAPQAACDAAIRTVLLCSPSLGGQNAAVVLRAS